MPQASGSPAPLAEIAPQLRLVAPQDDVGLAQLTDSFHLNLTAFGLLSFAVGLFIVHAAVGLAFEQRRVMFRTLRALGVSLDVLTAALASELAVFAVAGGAFGVALGYALAGFLLPDVAATLRGLYGADVAGGLQLPALWWAGGLGIALAGTAVAGAQSLYRLRRMPLLAPARPRAWARPGKAALLRQFALCCGLALGALALAIWGRGLISGFSLIGAMMMSAALAMPLVMGGLLRWASGRARRALAQWFWSDTAHQLPGLSLALMALLLAVSANIGVATMVGSFRSAFQGFLDQRLAPELYISVPEATRRAEVEEFLIQRAEAVLPIWRADVGLEGQPGRLYGFRDHPTYRESWPLIASGPDAWARVVRGDAVLINEQLARRMDLWPGDSLRLPAGPPVPIAGVYSDYGSPRPQAMMSLQLIGARAAQIDKSSFAVRIDPNRADTLARDLVSRFGLTDDEVIDQAGLKAFSLGVFDRTFTITAALNGLTLGVAGIAVLTGLLTLARMRLPQLAPVWALGLTRAQLGRLELGRALLLAVLVFVLALPVGLCLAWILLAVVNVEAFGWRIPMRLFPWDWAGLAATTVLAAAAAAAWPAWRLAHTPPADLLKVFGHER